MHSDLISYAGIATRQKLNSMVLPQNISVSTLHMFGELMYNEGLFQISAHLNERMRKELLAYKNSMVNDNRDKAEIHEAIHESFRLMKFDFDRMTNVKHEARLK